MGGMKETAPEARRLGLSRRRRLTDTGFLAEVLSERRSRTGLVLLGVPLVALYVLFFGSVEASVGSGFGVTAEQVSYSILVGAMLALVLVAGDYWNRFGCCKPSHSRTITRSTAVAAVMTGAPAAFVGCCGATAPAVLVAALGGIAMGSIAGPLSVALGVATE
jgi:hypothetical protein